MKITLITVAFNSEATIRETFESVQHQNQDGFELEYILVDGGSTDETIFIANQYNNILTRVISEPDDGIYDAMNKGLGCATGQIVGFLNSDDTFATRTVLKEVIDTFNSDLSPQVVYGDVNYIDAQGEIKRRWRSGSQRDFVSGWHPAHPAFYARRHLFEKHGGFNCSYRIAADFDLMLRFLDVARALAVYNANVMIDMKIGGESNRSLKNIIDGNREIRASFVEHGLIPQPAYTIRRLIRKILQRFLPY